MLGQVQVSIFGADNVPDTLVGSCGSNPGLACRLVWNITHDGQAAAVTNSFLAGPVHLLLKVLFVVLLAFLIQFIVHRVINRLTERATSSLLSQWRGSMANSRFVPSRPGNGRNGSAGRARRRRSASDDSMAADAAAAQAAVADSSSAAQLSDAPALAGADAAGGASQGEINGAAAQAEAAIVDERRKQRVRALGAILRSIASITIFSIAGFVILGDLGINLAPLLASAGVVGVAIGFGAQSLVRDYLSGIFMLVEDQYGVGDVITVGNATGTVETVTLRVTRMRDVNGIVWHIRNGTIDTVGNESQGWARAVIDFPVPFAADLATIRHLLARTGDEMWNEPIWRAVMLEAPEVWGAQALSSTEVTMRMVVKTAPLRQWEVEREMRARVKRALKEAGIVPPPAEKPTMAVTLIRDE
ncbi:mechanosensitive ion channel family protein [Trebonia kvetii]|uniref:Mechanosensitive ion channel family protein n=1 Tax=Trebonia kvetii TaxID=2480626 RepID=A0A6P2BQV9_9ACTN|nr:mechanosensitive ion channel family protein [Trebonia kvetii]TVZ01404.1 mechanosensitive ion channel family protein [Trebonia kvetii]